MRTWDGDVDARKFSADMPKMRTEEIWFLQSFHRLRLKTIEIKPGQCKCGVNYFLQPISIMLIAIIVTFWKTMFSLIVVQFQISLNTKRFRSIAGPTNASQNALLYRACIETKPLNKFKLRIGLVVDKEARLNALGNGLWKAVWMLALPIGSWTTTGRPLT